MKLNNVAEWDGITIKDREEKILKRMDVKPGKY